MVTHFICFIIILFHFVAKESGSDIVHFNTNNSSMNFVGYQTCVLNKQKTTKQEQFRFMQMAVDLSQYALNSKSGGPFGAIVVKDKKIIGSSGNCVLKNCGPTAHAEIMAIRDACKNLQNIDLSGCEIYSSAEPCPLCTAAIYWSKINTVYYSNTEDDAMNHGFIDKEILAELKLSKEKRSLKFQQLVNPMAIQIFREALESF